MNQGLNVIANPLPNHAKPVVNMIGVKDDYKVKKNIKEVKTSMRLVWQILIHSEVLNAVER